MTATRAPDIQPLRDAIDGDRARLADALGLRRDGNRYFCHRCQNGGGHHVDGDLSVEAGFRCHKCGWTGDGLSLVREVRGCDFPAAVAFARDVYGVAVERPRKAQGTRKTGKAHKAIDDAADAALWAVGKSTGQSWTETRRDIYQDADGKDIAAVLRFDRADGATDSDGKAIKTFRPIHAVAGGWSLGDPAGKWPLFRLPEIMAADTTVLICEGEKAASAGAGVGLVATASAHGAKAPEKTDWAPVADRHVVILPDNDEAGREYAEAVATLCHNAGARSVRILELPGLPPKGDLADFVAAGGTAEQVKRLAREAQPCTPPATAQAQPGSAIGPEAIRAALWKIAQEKLSTTESYRKTAGAVLEWLHARGRFYFHAERRDFASVMYFDGACKLLLPVQSDAFLAWLADALAMNRAERSFSFVSTAVETEGLSERSTGIMPATYWSATEKNIYLSNGPGRMARISPEGVTIVDNGTDGILFPYGATLEPWSLTDPLDPFEACALFRDMSHAAPHGRDLFRLWAVSLPSDQKTKPPLCAAGVIGSGKTKLIRGLFDLYGMPERVAAVHKNGEGDFWATLDGGGLACWDNVDTRIDWLPDALAAAATAGTLEKRRLYTDADRVSLRARAWVAVTSASASFAGDAGLADRLIVIRLNRRQGATAETALSDEVRRNRSAGLSWICEALSRALADENPPPILSRALADKKSPPVLNARHPDFARLAVRIGRAIGRESEAVAALQAAERDKGLFNLENDPIGAALLEVVEAGPFNGNAAELLEQIKLVDSSFEGRLSVKRLGKRLDKLWPHLENTLGAAKDRDGHTRTWRYFFNPPAGFAGFETLFSGKSPRKENIRTFAKTPLETPQTTQTASDDGSDDDDGNALIIDMMTRGTARITEVLP